ncbi:MAG: hypothetical protein CR972_04020 [Candidatus Moraniibacteriota bacterium]|nr:MAG: hypothetical protein CR972_04020 [Candidatus Moranbacteria bacterium]
MQWKEPRNSEKYFWTEHAKLKMKKYGLTGQRVTRVIRAPMRTEESIVGGNVIAVMQPQSTKRGADGTKTWSNEIWVMYKIVEKKGESKKKNYPVDDVMAQFLQKMTRAQKHICIISAWRFPGKTEPGESLPDEIVKEIAEVM